MGIAGAWVCYLWKPELPGKVVQQWGGIYRVLDKKYGFDEFYQRAFADGARGLGEVLSEWGDRRLIDGWLVNGAARVVARTASVVRHVQSGLVYHYAFVMIIGLVALMSWFLFR